MGFPPYYNDNLQKMYKEIKSGKLKFPNNISAEAKSLISVNFFKLNDL